LSSSSKNYKRNVFAALSFVNFLGLAVFGILAYTEKMVQDSENLRLCDRVDKAMDMRCKVDMLTELTTADRSCDHKCEAEAEASMPPATQESHGFLKNIQSLSHRQDEGAELAEIDMTVSETCQIYAGSGSKNHRDMHYHHHLVAQSVGVCTCGAIPFHLHILHEMNPRAKNSNVAIDPACTVVTMQANKPYREVDCVYVPKGLTDGTKAEILLETTAAAEQSKCDGTQNNFSLESESGYSMNAVMGLLMGWFFLISCVGLLDQEYQIRSSKILSVADSEKLRELHAPMAADHTRERPLVPLAPSAKDEARISSVLGSGDFYRLDQA